MLDFTSGAGFDSRITFSRGSNATLVDSTGKITYAPANLALRTTFAGGTGGVVGSGAVAPTGWSFFGGTGAVSYRVDPQFGGTIIDFTGVAQRPYIVQSVSVLANTNYIFSLYVAANTSQIAANIATISALPAGAVLTLYVNGVLRDSSVYVPVEGDRLAYLLQVAATAGSIQLRAGLGASSAATGTCSVSAPQVEPVTYQTVPGAYNATTTAAYYGPRFDYDPVTLAAKGLLIEEQRTNLLTYSEQFGSWTNSGATVTANSIAAPSGETSADTIVRAGFTSDAIYNTATFTGDGVKVVSIWIKKGTSPSSLIALLDATTSAYRLWADITWSGTTPSLAFTNGSLISSSNYGNGWWRLELATTAVTAANGNRVYVYPGRTGSANGDTVYVWGAQAENAAFATSYIPTVASTVTRSADVATMTGTNFSSWYNQSEGTFVAAFDMAGGSAALSSNRAALVARESATSNHYIYNGSGQVTGWTVVSGVDQAFLTTGALAADTATNMAYAYKINDFAASRNGGTVATDTSGTLPAPTVLGIGNNSAGSLFLSGHIRSIAYYNTRLPNATLQTLTAPQMNTTLRLDFINGIYEG
jgi:hypothetical protein